MIKRHILRANQNHGRAGFYVYQFCEDTKTGEITTIDVSGCEHNTDRDSARIHWAHLIKVGYKFHKTVDSFPITITD